MSADERFATIILGICALFLVGFVACAHQTVPQRIQIAPPTSTTLLGVACVDAYGFPYRAEKCAP